MMVTFGALLRASHSELDNAGSLIAVERGPGVAASERQLCRLVVALSRFADDLAADPGVASLGGQVSSDAWTQAAAVARDALRAAGAELRLAVEGDLDPPIEGSGQAASHLFGAAVSLAAGRDLLQTHFETDAHGVPTGRSDWSEVVTSAAVTAALLEELGGWAARLASMAVRLGESNLPDPARGRLRITSRLLAAAAEAVGQAQQAEAATESGRQLLSAVPAYTVPARRQLGDPEPVAGLCTGLLVSSERLRMLARRPAALASWSPAATPAAWRSTAAATAAAGHASGLVLRSLTRRAAQVGHNRAVVERLREATEAVHAAWPAWRGVAIAWGRVTTATTRSRSGAVIEVGDLVLRMGRLAWDDPTWNPSRARSAMPRTPEHLAPTSADIKPVAAAVHHTWDALAKMASTNLAAVQAAANAGRGLAADSGQLYVPTRSQLNNHQAPGQFDSARTGPVAALLDTYQAAIQASQAAVRALDAAAVTLDLPSSLLATAREAAAHQRHPVPQRQDSPPPRRGSLPESAALGRAGPAASSADFTPSPNPPTSAVTPARRPGPVEQAILRLGLTDQPLLLRAAAIDKAGRDLIAEARQTAARSAPQLASPTGAIRPNPAGDAAQLAASSFPSSPAAPLTGHRPEASPQPASRQAPKAHAPRPRAR
jgi:hypothetical protein